MSDEKHVDECTCHDIGPMCPVCRGKANNNRLPATERYQRDPTFRVFVDLLRSMIARAEYTPTELREAAILAATMHETMTIRPMLVFENVYARNGETFKEAQERMVTVLTPIWKESPGSGVCYCGAPMDGHPGWDNHAPTEMPLSKEKK